MIHALYFIKIQYNNPTKHNNLKVYIKYLLPENVQYIVMSDLVVVNLGWTALVEE